MWLKTVKDAKHLGLPVLQTRAWLLLPGSELAQQRASPENVKEREVDSPSSGRGGYNIWVVGALSVPGACLGVVDFCFFFSAVASRLVINVQGFWAPFHQKVSCGLREVPLIPVRGSEELLPMSRCRKPDSVLLKTLGLGLKDLALVNLGIPTEVPCHMQNIPCKSEKINES